MFTRRSCSSGRNPLKIIPSVGCQAVDYIGLDRYYVHGWDPATRPAFRRMRGMDQYRYGYGRCGRLRRNSTVTRVSGAYYGMTFTVGSSVTIGGIRTASPACLGLTAGILNGRENAQFTITGTPAISGTESPSRNRIRHRSMPTVAATICRLR